MLPIDPHAVIAHWCEESSDGDRAEPRVIEQERRNLLLVGISDGLACLVRLVKVRGGVGKHALFGSGFEWCHFSCWL